MSQKTQPNIRNVAIIAHVDHGKTSLVDAMLKQTGVYKSHETVVERALDSIDLERERGITILAKSTSVLYRNTRINIIDTPGHADFGGEVERTLLMADGALLLVDAAEGPLPQTRFVLKHALGLGIPIIVVINKIDRQDARPDEVLNETFDLFCDLGATDQQADFKTLYTIATRGVCLESLGGREDSLEPLFQAILQHVPPPKGNPKSPLQLLVTNVTHDDYVGRIAVGRIENGQLLRGQQVMRMASGTQELERVGQIFGFEGLKRVKRDHADAGDVVALSGITDVQIGDTITDPDMPVALPRIEVEAPIIKVRFQVNTSPFAGKSGKFITSRNLVDRLERESRKNLAMRFEETDQKDVFIVYGRGELMVSVLVETMRREGYELSLGNPEVVVKKQGEKSFEPSERVVIDVPDEHVGIVTRGLGQRRGRMDKMVNLGFGRTRLEFVAPARGLIGYRPQFLTETRGTGLINTFFEDWIPYTGPMLRRKNGAMVADRSGITTTYALFHLEPRGSLCIGPGTAVYEGMIVGEHNRPADINVNVCKEKKLTNIRAAGRDENLILTPPVQHTIETAMEFIDRDELIEITPEAVRIRKRELMCSRRRRRSDSI